MTDPLSEAERRFRGAVQIPVPLAAPPTVEQLRVLFAEYDRMRRDIHGVAAVIAERDHLRAALTDRNYGCRCRPCTDAHARDQLSYQRERRQAI